MGYREQAVEEISKALRIVAGQVNLIDAEALLRKALISIEYAAHEERTGGMKSARPIPVHVSIKRDQVWSAVEAPVKGESYER